MKLFLTHEWVCGERTSGQQQPSCGSMTVLTILRFDIFGEDHWTAHNSLSSRSPLMATASPTATAIPADVIAPPAVSSYVLRVISDALLIVDGHQFLFANKSFEDLCDYPNCRLLSEPYLLLQDEHERQAFFHLVADHLSGEKDLFNESIVECHNSSSGLFLARVTFHPFLDELDQHKPKCICVFSDPMFFKSLFINSSALLGVLEHYEEQRDCLLLRSNEVLSQLLMPEGTTSSFLQRANSSLSTPVVALFALNRRLAAELGFVFDEQDLQFFLRCRSRATPYLKRFRIQKLHSKQAVYLEATLTYLGRSLKGRSLFAFVANDVTQIQGLETKLEDSQRQLEAQRAFFSKMIHELRTPLTGMLGMTSVLRNTVLTSEQTESLKTIDACGDSVLALVGNILDLSNLERNQVVLLSEPFALVECVEQTLEIVSLQAMTKQIELTYALDNTIRSSHVLMVRGDVIRIRQILLNLLSNAIKFTSIRGHVTVRLSVAAPIESSQLQTVVTFAVEDDGIGIADAAKPLLFKAFSQGSTSIAQTYGGSGLGLAIVKSLAELMNGSIRVESTEGRGSTFIVSLQLQACSPSPLMAVKRRHSGIDFIPSLSSSDATVDLRNELANMWRGKCALLLLRDVHLASNLASRLAAYGIQCQTHADSRSADVLFCEREQSSSQSVDNTMRHLAKMAKIPMIIVDWKLLQQQQQPQQPQSTSVPLESDTASAMVYYLRKPIRECQLVELLCKAFDTPHPLTYTNASALPIAQEEQQGDTKRATRAHSPTSTFLRVLVVEDNIVNRKAIRAMLESLGVAKSSIYVASNGLDAIASLKQQMVDLILMDVLMPVMNGLDATREIRQLWPQASSNTTTKKHQRPLMIAALTADATSDARNECFKAGMDEFLTKPVRLEALSVVVNKAIQRLG